MKKVVNLKWHAMKKVLQMEKIWYTIPVFEIDRDKSPFEKSPRKWGFFFVGLAFPRHDSFLWKRKLYPYRPTLPVRKFEIELFHKEKVLENKSPYSHWK